MSPSLALERTTMAWLRTALIMSVVALFFLRFTDGGLPVLALTLAGVAVSWGLGVIQWWRHPLRQKLFESGETCPERAAALLVTGLVVLLAALGVTLVLRGA